MLGAASASALSLGRASGAVLLGRPLDLLVQVRLDTPDELAQPCVEADVFHADTRVNPSRVVVTLEPGAAPQQAVLRIRSSAPVDEPMVTVYLQAGCQQRVSRRYVLLSEVPPETVARPPVGVATAPEPQRGTDPTPAPAASGVTLRAAPAAAPGPSVGAGPARSNRAAVPAPQPTPPRAARSAPRPVQSRLRLDPLELMAELDVPLRASPELLSQPSDDAQVRIQAQALWRALNAQPQDVLRDAERMQALETDVKALREMFAANQASLAALRGELQQARDERYANGLVYTLIAALLVLGGVLAWRWHQGARPKRVREWWRRDDWASDSLRELEAEAVAEPLQYPEARWPQRAAAAVGESSPKAAAGRAAAVAAAATPPDGTPTRAEEAQDSADPTVLQALPPLTDFGISTTGGVRAMNTEELLDVQQQADFFLSLGQHDQAIELLLNHIEQDEHASALPYLDLLEIYHQLGQREPYEVLRAEINRVFNADAPVFDAYEGNQRGLADYPAALSRIESLWPSPKVLAVIEESLFRKSASAGDAPLERFDLGAYRELLLLYTVARQIIQSGADDAALDAVPQFVTTSILPLPATAASDVAPAPAPVAPLLEWDLPNDPAPAPDSSAALGEIGLDIDLASLSPPPEEPVELLPPDNAFDLATERLGSPRRTPLH